MKVVKSIGLFFAIGCIGMLLGFLLGTAGVMQRQTEAENGGYRKTQKEYVPENTEEFAGRLPAADEAEDPGEGVLDVSGSSCHLNSDTQYVIRETDERKGTVVETVRKLPKKYIGMDRDSFLASMRQYSLSPPLTERERGFQGLEVLSFSDERVIVQMNYQYVQPEAGKGFYVALMDHQLIVLLEDQKTVYIRTGLSDQDLPQELLTELTGMIYMDSEDELYGFLEAYSS
ncbi:MAG: hypothetical protein J5898_03435 [Lachnospiraceae bacterium]|nr:hypothetical protein [Lachnospiraceae bacterium]